MTDEPGREAGLRRRLTAGQMAMVAVGGSIGTGLLLGSAAALEAAGPAVVLTFLFAALITGLVAMALSDLASHHPAAVSFQRACDTIPVSRDRRGISRARGRREYGSHAEIAENAEKKWRRHLSLRSLRALRETGIPCAARDCHHANLTPAEQADRSPWRLGVGGWESHTSSGIWESSVGTSETRTATGKPAD